MGLFFLFIGGAILTVGDIFMKQWVVSSNRILYAVGMAFYILGMAFLAQSFKSKNIAIASVLFVLFNVVTLTIVSIFLYNEKPSTIQFIGMAFAIFSVFLLG